MFNERQKINDFSSICLNTLSVVISMSIILVTVFLTFCCWAFREINKQLMWNIKKLQNNQNLTYKNYTKQRQLEINSSYDILRLSSLYKLCWKIHTKFNDCITIGPFIWLNYQIVTMTGDIFAYYYFTSVEEKLNGPLEFIQIIYILLNVYEFGSVFYQINLTNNEAAKTRDIVITCATNFFDDPVTQYSRNIEIFAMQFIEHKVDFHSLRMHKMNMKMCFNALTSILSTIILVIQFEQKNQNKRIK